MSDDPLRRCRDRLLAIREKTRDPLLRVELAKAIGDLDDFERVAPPEALEQWRRVHAKNWSGTKNGEKVLRLFLALGDVHRDEIAAIIGTDDEPASNVAVRGAIRRLREDLEKAKATATVKPAGRDGVYRTHDPTFQRPR
jgi:hypothetical protein